MSDKYELYVITDEKLPHGLRYDEIARRAVNGGADVIQLRDKELSDKEFYDVAIEIRSITIGSGTMFIVNDRMDVALACKADGVHLGQGDMPLPAARKLVPSDFIIGISVSNIGEAVLAESFGADYVALGPIFPTSSKNDAGPGVGLDSLREMRAAVSIPLVAIGGIGASNINEVIMAGADGVAVISAVVGQPDIAMAVRSLKTLIVRAKKDRAMIE